MPPLRCLVAQAMFVVLLGIVLFARLLLLLLPTRAGLPSMSVWLFTSCVFFVCSESRLDS